MMQFRYLWAVLRDHPFCHHNLVNRGCKQMILVLNETKAASVLFITMTNQIKRYKKQWFDGIKRCRLKYIYSEKMEYKPRFRRIFGLINKERLWKISRDLLLHYSNFTKYLRANYEIMGLKPFRKGVQKPFFSLICYKIWAWTLKMERNITDSKIFYLPS